VSTADAKLPAAPRLPGPPPAVLIVRAPYYQGVVDGLTEGAARILDEAGARHETLDVAGAFELAQAIRIAVSVARAGGRRFDGFVALGCVVRGETDHYDFICQASMQGLMQVALDHAVALGTGLLTVDSLAQAEARSGQDGHNKGAEAAVAALVQISVARRLGGI
jgi:6,7-dimethyl-8-ribityllumazine synthase